MRAKKNILLPGFTIIELLIALAISGLLLASLAVAIKASFMNYDQNQDIFNAINKARQALTRITAQVRTGLVDPSDAASQDRCVLLCADGSIVTYLYDSNDNKLYLQEQATSNEYVLCDNITAMTFVKDNDTPTGDVRSVQVSMTVLEGDTEWTIAGAAIVRRVLE